MKFFLENEKNFSIHSIKNITLSKIISPYVINYHKITVLPLMPVIMALSIEYIGKIKSIKSVRYICTSGGEVQENVLKKLKKVFLNAKIYLMYGLTEAFRSTYLKPNKTFLKSNSIDFSVIGFVNNIKNQIEIV